MRTGIMQLIIFSVIVDVCAIGAQACDVCLDFGSLESRESCKVCSGTGKCWESTSVICDKCKGDGRDTYRLQGTQYGNYKTVRCRGCSGTGKFITKKSSVCPQCAGKGVLISRVPCYKCKGRPRPSPSQQAAVGDTGATMLAVETCKQCDSRGNISTEILCSRCDKGASHKKENEKFFCRKCGKECKDRFIPCACGKPDCPDCKGDYKRVESKPCNVCGGDKIITPLEREKLKERNKTLDTK